MSTIDVRPTPSTDETRHVLFTLPPLPYNVAALEPFMSAETLRIHHDKHHAAYVAGANRALEQMANARAAGDWATINQLETDLAFNVSGHVLHSIFWDNLSPAQGGRPTGSLAAAIEQDFGSFDGFRNHLRSTVSMPFS